MEKKKSRDKREIKKDSRKEGRDYSNQSRHRSGSRRNHSSDCVAIRSLRFRARGASWPREESNLRTQLRRLPLYPLSYGAEPTKVSLATARYAVRARWR